jgi:hypothetical protein
MCVAYIWIIAPVYAFVWLASKYHQKIDTESTDLKDFVKMAVLEVVTVTIMVALMQARYHQSILFSSEINFFLI